MKQHRDYMQLLMPYLARNKEAKILEIGCGNGLLIKYLHKMGYQNSLGIDTSPEQVAYCKREDIFAVEEADALKFILEKNEEYDLIMGFDIFEHFTKSEGFEFLSNAFHAIKPLGRIILRVPNMANLFGARSHFMNITHEVGYTEQSLRQILSVSKFDAIKIIPGKPNYFIKRAVSIFVSNSLHRVLYLFAGVPAPRITSKNIIAIAQKPVNFNN